MREKLLDTLPLCGYRHTLWPIFMGCPFISFGTALLLEKLLWGFRRLETRVWQAIPHLRLVDVQDV
jgi:hypothetical protein